MEKAVLSHYVAAALRRAFPAYSVTVRNDTDPPRFELVTLNGGNPWCVISSDPEEIRTELGGQ